MAEKTSPKIYSAHLNVPFPTEREAEIAYNVLRVDSEPKRSLVKKVLELDNKFLNVSLTAPELKQLRMSLTSFFDHLILVTETLGQFGPTLTETYTHT